MSKSFLSSIFIVGLMGYWRLSPVPWLRYERLTCCCMILLEIRGFFTTHFHAFSNVTLLFWAVMFCNLVDILFYFIFRLFHSFHMFPSQNCARRWTTLFPFATVWLEIILIVLLVCSMFTPNSICNCSFRSWRMPLQYTTRPVAALVHLSELGMLIYWIVRAHRRNPQKLAHGRFYKISSPPSIASPPPAHFPPTLDLTVISSGESSVSPVNESGVVWIIVSHSWMGKCVL